MLESRNLYQVIKDYFNSSPKNSATAHDLLHDAVERMTLAQEALKATVAAYEDEKERIDKEIIEYYRHIDFCEADKRLLSTEQDSAKEYLEKLNI